MSKNNLPKDSCGRFSCHCDWIAGKQTFCERDPSEDLGFFKAEEASAAAVSFPPSGEEASAAAVSLLPSAEEASAAAVSLPPSAVVTPTSLKRTASVAFAGVPPPPEKKKRRKAQTERVPTLPLLVRSCTSFHCTCGGEGVECVRYGGTGLASAKIIEGDATASKVVLSVPLSNLTRSCTAFLCTCGGLESGGGGCIRYGGTGAASAKKDAKD